MTEKQVVRRLTPTECERLQGFPDGWTDGQADSHRYKQMGNAVAVPVIEWIINRMTN
jgi:DNA (cytosine-5)-methyltransferase 1